jgi:hypothetical protein
MDGQTSREREAFVVGLPPTRGLCAKVLAAFHQLCRRNPIQRVETIHRLPRLRATTTPMTVAVSETMNLPTQYVQVL